jgi:predicted AAA+ superfamily ATPase
VESNNYSGVVDNLFRLTVDEARTLLRKRLAEPAPGRIQLVAGPRQVGKTTLLLELARRFKARSVYAAADSPEAALPGFWERLWSRAADIARSKGAAYVFLDEVHLFADWAARLKGIVDQHQRERTPIHIVATGSSSLKIGEGSRESLAGRFERMTIAHWSASTIARTFRVKPDAAVDLCVKLGSYPGAFRLRRDRARWSAYLRDSIIEPALGKDVLALAPVKKPALLRQIFAVAASSPAKIVALQKLQGQLQDKGALETLQHYLSLLEEAFLVVALPKHSDNEMRRRAAPPKLVVLNNALLAAVAPLHVQDGVQFGAFVENACLAHAWNAGQSVSYWREEPLEVDAVIEGTWGSWAVEVKTGPYAATDLRGLLELARRVPRLKPLVLCDDAHVDIAGRAGVDAMPWRRFLLDGVSVRG